MAISVHSLSVLGGEEVEICGERGRERKKKRLYLLDLESFWIVEALVSTGLFLS